MESSEIVPTSEEITTVAELIVQNDVLTRTVTNLVSVIQSHQKSIEILSARAISDGEAIGQLGEMVAFLLQGQQDVTAYIQLKESAKHGKVIRNVVTSSDGDLPN